ncbi:MAG: hypothetical protein AAGA68_18785 [Pseudomonadota bacterium]
MLFGAYHGWIYQTAGAFEARYAPVLAALLPFSVGAVIYFSRPLVDRLSSASTSILLVAGLLSWLVNLLAAGAAGGMASGRIDVHFYTNLGALAVVVMALSHRRYRRRASGWQKRCGDLSYPVFLVHWQSGYVVSHLLLIGQGRGWQVLAWAAPLILLLVWLADALATRSLEPLRDRVAPTRSARSARDDSSRVSGRR